MPTRNIEIFSLCFRFYKNGVNMPKMFNLSYKDPLWTKQTLQPPYPPLPPGPNFQVLSGVLVGAPKLLQRNPQLYGSPHHLHLLTLGQVPIQIQGP